MATQRIRPGMTETVHVLPLTTMSLLARAILYLIPCRRHVLKLKRPNMPIDGAVRARSVSEGLFLALAALYEIDAHDRS